ncbi:hypothetical protein, partial [Thalassococcus profundi]|uniref:hypothetical protein n=1 Tax=Thalassococcus profundi TaxID=2282382 RepID=UPI0040586BAB
MRSKGRADIQKPRKTQMNPGHLRIIASSRLRTIHHNLEAALTATGVNDASGETNASAARASAKSRFESTKQRF